MIIGGFYYRASEARVWNYRCRRLGGGIALRTIVLCWDLAQDGRRRIFEDVSRHTSIGLRYLPEIARRLHHSRDLGKPFDFITWFDYAPEHERDFDALLAELRASEEWTYVEREIDIRLVQIG